jgi:hypothetical protein
MDVTLYPVERLENGARLYRAAVSYPHGQSIQLQSTISEDLHAHLAQLVAKARGWVVEHVHTGQIGGCSATPGLCPRDVAGALFVGVSEALAELPSSNVRSDGQLISWSWDDYGLDYDRLVVDLTDYWQECYGNSPMVDYMGAQQPARHTGTVPSRAGAARTHIRQAPAVVYYAYALAAS